MKETYEIVALDAFGPLRLDYFIVLSSSFIVGRGWTGFLTVWVRLDRVVLEAPMKLDRITVNPDVCQGQPTIRGLRITVAFLMKQIAAGMAPADILKAYPELEAEDLSQAAEYAAWLAGEQARPLPTPDGR